MRSATSISTTTSTSSHSGSTDDDQRAAVNSSSALRSKPSQSSLFLWIGLFTPRPSRKQNHNLLRLPESSRYPSLENFGVPKSIDSSPAGSIWVALAIDGGLLALFALQHSIMARPWFKRAWTRFVPVPVERSTYVLLSSAALLLMFWQWRAIGGIIWDVGSGAAQTIMFGV